MTYIWHLLSYFGIYLLLASSLNLVVGYCGLITLAHAAYFAVGAYTYALTTTQLGWDFISALSAGVLAAGILSTISRFRPGGSKETSSS